MKKRRFTRLFALLLAVMMVFALPMEASAATKKVTAVKDYQKSKAVKTGSTVVTVLSSAQTGAMNGYVKFTATSSKTYKFTFSNLRVYGRSSSQDICSNHVSFYQPTSYGKRSLMVKQNGKKVYSLPLCSEYSWSISHPKKVTSYTYTTSRTASIKMNKGETIYIYFSNTKKTKLCYDLKIK